LLWRRPLLDPPDYQHFGKIMLGADKNPLKNPVWATHLEAAPQ
jgi:hypothetical protein